MEIKDNPLVSITLRFEDDSGLLWAMSRPIAQVEMMADVGRLAAKWDVALAIMPIPGPLCIECHGVLDRRRFQTGWFPSGSADPAEVEEHWFCQSCNVRWEQMVNNELIPDGRAVGDGISEIEVNHHFQPGDWNSSKDLDVSSHCVCGHKINSECHAVTDLLKVDRAACLAEPLSHTFAPIPRDHDFCRVCGHAQISECHR